MPPVIIIRREVGFWRSGLGRALWNPGRKNILLFRQQVTTGIAGHEGVAGTAGILLIFSRVFFSGVFLFAATFLRVATTTGLRIPTDEEGLHHKCNEQEGYYECACFHIKRGRTFRGPRFFS